ncbi:transposase [Mucisphaera calidilacus]|uniref:transposase n=1 Tax=Mucisphaera calidilacus TaxID=2527982 RepID=UPI001F2E8F36|nr:transposase [Mucisphaera calidilacus]
MATYFLTWTTYGTRLHGDHRGSVDKRHHTPGTPLIPTNVHFSRLDRSRLKNPPIILNPRQRQIVDQTIRDHCRHRSWTLHAINVRTNHVHTILSADVRPEVALGQLKAWSSRRLRQHHLAQERIWTTHGSTRWINTSEAFSHAVHYVQNCQ